MLSKFFIFTWIFFILSLIYIFYQYAAGFEEGSKSISQNLEIAIDDDGFFFPNLNHNEYNNFQEGIVNDNISKYENIPSIDNKKKNEDKNQQSPNYLKSKDNYLDQYRYNNQYKYKNEFIVKLDPYQIVSSEKYNIPDSSGIAYLLFDSSFKELFFKVFLKGLSHFEGDDVEIIQIHFGEYGKNGPPILSLCNEKKEKGHCREGPGLSVEGILNEKDLKGPIKDSSFKELIQLFEYGQSYVYVQTRENPEGEVRGQISSY